MANQTAESIKDLLSVKEVLEFYGVRFDKKGFALCPFHYEKTASLSIKDDRYRCFGCGASGSVIDFVMKYFDLSFGQAIVKLSNDFALDLPVSKVTYRDRTRARKIHEKRQNEEKQKEAKKEIYAIFTDIYRELAQDGWPGAQAYLDKLEDWLDDKLEAGWVGR